MNTVRVRFSKQGPLRFTSHLDLNRAVQRALQRAGLPVWYTEGFNPHLYITFANPLPLGFESEAETFDVRLLEEMPESVLLSRLNAAFPPGLIATAAWEAEASPSAIRYADYTIRFLLEGLGADESLRAFSALAARPDIMVDKKTKKGVKLVDIRPMFTVLSEEVGGDLALVTLRCDAGSDRHLNPTLLTDALSSGENRDFSVLRPLRTRILCENLADFR